MVDAQYMDECQRWGNQTFLEAARFNSSWLQGPVFIEELPVYAWVHRMRCDVLYARCIDDSALLFSTLLYDDITCLSDGDGLRTKSWLHRMRLSSARLARHSTALSTTAKFSNHISGVSLHMFYCPIRRIYTRDCRARCWMIWRSRVANLYDACAQVGSAAMMKLIEEDRCEIKCVFHWKVWDQQLYI